MIYNKLYKAKKGVIIIMLQSISNRRNNAGLSTAELSAKTGISERTLRAYEAGEKDTHKMRITNAVRLAYALHCNIEDILQ